MINQAEFDTNDDRSYSNGSMKYWVAQVGGEYHRNFNNENFEDYFRENILDKLTEPSIIIMDRASYHKKFPDDMFFPSKAKKNEIKALMRKISDMIQIVLRKIKTHCFISPGISQKYP